MKSVIYVSCALIILSTVLASGCALGPRKYVSTERLEIKQKTTKEGIQVVVAEKKVEQAEKNVIEQSTNVKSVTKITLNDEKDKDKITIGNFNFSPDGLRIVMNVLRQSSGTFTSQLWSIGKDGGAATKITEGNYQDIDPSYSSKGKYIYFSTNRGDSHLKIWRIMSTGTGGLTKITSGSTTDLAPSESPDGEKIVFESLMAGDTRSQIWTSATNGALPTQITVGTTPAFSPDGSKILFCKSEADEHSSKKEKWHIWLMDSDGSNRTQLTESETSENWATWTPDGKRILFGADSGIDNNGNKNFDIYIMNADGTGKTQLTTNGSADIRPVMDPEGRNIYFLSNRGGAWNIWRMELAVNN